MKRFSGMAATMGFLGLALVGWFSDVDPLVCALRALGGAVAIYFLVGIAGRMILSIVVDAVVTSRVDAQRRRSDEA